MKGFINIEEWTTFFIFLAIIFGFLALGWLLEKRLISKLLRLTQKRQWELYGIIILSLRGIGLLWSLILGITIALSVPSLPFNPTLILIIKEALLATFLGSATWVIAKLSVGILRFYTTGDDGISPLTSLFEFLAQVLIFSVGFLIILQSIGISITPLLTAFGIGGVSLGLALQGTLSNLMSGINIITSKKVRPGDYIQIKSGEAGYVKDVDLKYTIVQEITDNILVIPNTKIISSSFRNYNLPDRTMIVPVEVGISYESDLEAVEKITLEVAKEVLKNDRSGISSYQPFIRYSRFDYESILFNVYLKVQEEEIFDHLKIKHEFIKRLHQRYKQEEIELSYPIKLSFLPKANLQDFDERF